MPDWTRLDWEVTAMRELTHKITADLSAARGSVLNENLDGFYKHMENAKDNSQRLTNYISFSVENQKSG